MTVTEVRTPGGSVYETPLTVDEVIGLVKECRERDGWGILLKRVPPYTVVGLSIDQVLEISSIS